MGTTVKQSAASPERTFLGDESSNKVKAPLQYRLRTLLKLLVLCTCLVQAVCAEETTTVPIALQEIRIDSTAAAHRTAAFVTMDDDKKQIVIRLSGPDRITDVNSKNIRARGPV